jgi:L-amino acid N-acyltransferase YncA
MILRKVSEEDIEILFRLANDPIERQMAFQQKPIKWEDHVSWFSRVDKEHFFVAEDEGKVVGLVRITDGIVSVNVAPESRHKGYGSLMLQAIKGPAKAYVKVCNRASQRAFEKAGFSDGGQVIFNDVRCILYYKTDEQLII